MHRRCVHAGLAKCEFHAYLVLCCMTAAAMALRFSCSSFSAQEVLEHLNEFELISYEYMYIDRNDEMKIVEHFKSEV